MKLYRLAALVLVGFGMAAAAMWIVIAASPTPTPLPHLDLHRFAPPHDGQGWYAVTPEREAALKGDPVYQFCEHVNNVAASKPYWNTDYRRAHYDAFVECANDHALELLRAKGLIDDKEVR